MQQQTPHLPTSVLPLACPLPQPCQHAHFHIPARAQATVPLMMLKLTLASFLCHLLPAKLATSSSSNFHSKVCVSQCCSLKVDGAREGVCKKNGCWTSFWRCPFIGCSQVCVSCIGGSRGLEMWGREGGQNVQCRHKQGRAFQS